MTSRDLLLALLRRWYLVLLGAALTLGAGFGLLQHPGVYWTRFEVVVLPPLESVNPNNLQRSPYDLVGMAGLLVTEANDGSRPQRTASSDTTLYGEGVHRGYRIRLHNSGSQWVVVHDAPVIDVQVVDPDAAVVEAESRRIVARLGGILDRRQDELQIRPSSRMSVEPSPTDPVIQYVSGSRIRALLGTAVLGVAGTFTAVWWIDRLLLRRRASQDTSAVSQPDRPLTHAST